MEEQGFKNEFDDIDKTAVHMIAFENDKAVATSRLYYSESRNCYVLGRIAVLKEFRGKDYGRAVVCGGEEYVKSHGFGRVELSAQVKAKDFYKKLGYKELNEITDDEGCPHVWMRKEL